jgi:hypothetical protein
MFLKRMTANTSGHMVRARTMKQLGNNSGYEIQYSKILANALNVYCKIILYVSISHNGSLIRELLSCNVVTVDCAFGT